jgi:predicted Zn-dependent protease
LILRRVIAIGCAMRQAVVMLIAAAAVAGCQITGTTAPSRVDPVAVTAPRAPQAAEEAIGARENPRVLAEYGGVYSRPEIEKELAGIVARLVAASDDPTRRYRITILNSPVANAFALPGGYLYVTRGLLTLAVDASEVAAVLSHEMAHVIADHALQRARIVEQSNIVERVATEVLSDPTASETTLSRSRLSLAKFTRDQEIEADRIGIAIAAKAGYDPFAASRFLDKLEAYAAYRSAAGEKDDAANFLASHPAARERQALAIRVAREYGAPGVGEQGRDTYLDSLRGMVFGDDPSEGFVRGREFLHPRLAIAFRVPVGYRLENTREAVLASAGRDTAMRFDGVTTGAEVSPEEYLASGWINGLAEGSIRPIATGDMPAAVAEANAGEWTFRIGAVRVGPSMYRLIFAERGDGVAIDRALRQTLASFHRMSPADIARLRPLRIDIVTARPGDTVNLLAARMRGTDRRLTLFRLLNGLSRTDRVEPGRKYKIVVD